MVSEKRFRLVYDGSEDTVQRIAEACVNKHWGLTELTVEKSSLDAVFAKLSKEARTENL